MAMREKARDNFEVHDGIGQRAHKTVRIKRRISFDSLVASVRPTIPGGTANVQEFWRLIRQPLANDANRKWECGSHIRTGCLSASQDRILTRFHSTHQTRWPRGVYCVAKTTRITDHYIIAASKLA